MAGNRWRTLARRLAARGERRLVLVEGERAPAQVQVRRVLDDLRPAAGLWVGAGNDCPHSALTPVLPGEARHYLGSENPVLVWDGWQGNPPDALAALSGTLKAGGLWFWLVPPLAEWAQFPDPDYTRMGLSPDGNHPFLARMARVLDQTPTVIRLVADGSPEPPALADERHEGDPFRPGGTVDQSRAVDSIIHTGLGRRRRPLVITSDRGRGKSAALGLAAARLMRERQRQIAVVSPRREAVSALFRHAATELGLGEQGDSRLSLADGATLAWYPVDELLARRPDAELVLVDEAAAIPAPLLREILLGWPRVVFASTVHGYEGSGRGFSLRFRAVLDRETPRWQSLTLNQPIRWSPDDPLEPLVNRLFLLDAEAGGAGGGGDVVIEDWRPGEAGESELGRAFGLLVDAHYRTTPGDLRQWMDDPDAVSLVARQGDHIVGVLWATIEGGLEPALADRVLRGERRLKGHLLPQSLANHGGDAGAATLRILRVVRVAVHASCRRSGVGRQLLARATGQATSMGLDAIGTSYGAEPGLIAFWRSAGLRTVRLGFSREASSGEYAVQMLRGTGDSGIAAQRRLAVRFAEQWPVMLPVIWPTLHPALVLTISDDLPPATTLTEQEITELEAFAYGYRGLELTLPALKRLSLLPGKARRLGTLGAASLWVACVLQNQTWNSARAQGLCQGRREGEARLRAAAGRLLE